MTKKSRAVDDMLKATISAVGDISPRLHGLGPQVQGAVLADLFATFLAGHIGPDAVAVRDELIVEWLAMVRKLVPVCERKIIAALKVDGRC